MRPAIRRLAAAAILITVAAISVFGTLTWVWTREMNKPQPFLVRDLPGSGADAQNEGFRKRLKHRFPIGSSEADLAQELQTDGFVQTDWGGATGSPHQAQWRREGFPCMTDARVTWTADGQRRITGIDGLYGYICL
ncbi:MAG: hypothetical protein JWN66_1966 [Sphingomonas bacterium]|uniref:hypothetical protein n=1 Tax=Sphingomonas bacterium TaxID=1895847 RepID=UPI0026279E3F|nr:hypothetical protein [Sphingomonas bacterium]MDB5704850.1 hypothetical protein [Sphingomonas bacterium]